MVRPASVTQHVSETPDTSDHYRNLPFRELAEFGDSQCSVTLNCRASLQFANVIRRVLLSMTPSALHSCSHIGSTFVKNSATKLCSICRSYTREPRVDGYPTDPDFPCQKLPSVFGLIRRHAPSSVILCHICAHNSYETSHACVVSVWKKGDTSTVPLEHLSQVSILILC